MPSDPPNSAALAPAPAPASIVPYQSALSLVLILLLIGMFAAVNLLARSNPVAHWFNQHNLAVATKWHGHYACYDQFFDKIDYLWMRKLERADYSRGGVELFGSSVAICSLQDWALPPDQAALIHDYGYSGANMINTAHFIRFLIDHKGLLDAGPDKSLIILGLAYTDIRNSLEAKNYFQESIRRSGLYEYDPASGITLVPLNPFQRWLKSQEMLCRSFLMAVNALWPPPGPPVEALHARRNSIITTLGDRWPILLSLQMTEEARLLHDLKMRRVHVLGVLLPEGTWNADIPAHDQFMMQMRKLFADESIPLLDCTRIVPDSGFGDAIHCNMEGEPIIHRALMNIALDFLHHRGLLATGSAYAMP